MTSLIIAAAIISLAGHLAIWITFWNHTQGRAMPMWLLDSISLLAQACCGIVPFLTALVLISPEFHGPVRYGVFCYLGLCFLTGIVGFPITFLRRRQRRRARCGVRTETSRIVKSDRARSVSSRADVGPLTRLLIQLPSNQSFEIEVNQKELTIPRLPAALDGLRVAHISDLHYTGKVDRSFFHDAVDIVNESCPDLIAITGDLVDDIRYLPWIAPTMGRLRAKLGTFAILGNHDCKLSLPTIRRTLSESGISPLSGRIEKHEVAGTEIVLASNELPWIAPASDPEELVRYSDETSLRILLAHSPDVFPWAKRYDFDLMLAGHTHGGQFCIPGFGPFVCPSRLPLDYTSGTIFEAPTMLHVSRGLSAEVPLRLNCRPELTCLELRSESKNLPFAAQAVGTKQAIGTEFVDFAQTEV